MMKLIKNNNKGMTTIIHKNVFPNLPSMERNRPLIESLGFIPLASEEFRIHRTIKPLGKEEDSLEKELKILPLFLF